MRFLIADTYYAAFLRSVYGRSPGLARQEYQHQWRTLMDQCFGTADYYSANLQLLGHEAQEIIVNCDPLQRQWAREHARWLAFTYPFHAGLRRRRAWHMAVLESQVERFRPDILYIQDMNWVDTSLLQRLRGRVRLVVGQIASAVPQGLRFSAYDLVFTSFPHFVERFREFGVSSEYLRLAFEPKVLERLGRLEPVFDTVFVGGYADIHQHGTAILEAVSGRHRVDFWGYVSQDLPADSPIRERYHGEAWALDMYRILHQSRIALNRHSRVAEDYANNMRLYEATGVGSCLVTDMKDNLPELFEVDKEIVAYTGPEDCAEKVSYLLEHEAERAAIAKAGQQRTLREHTYLRRMQEMEEIVRRHLRAPRSW